MNKKVKMKKFLYFLLPIFGLTIISISNVEAVTINSSPIEARVESSSSTPFMSKGKASWYAHKGGLFAASPDYPTGTKLKVTSVNNPSKSIVVTVNDFGPDRSLHPERVIDLDKVAFEKLAPLGAGVIDVIVLPTEPFVTVPANTPNYTNGELWQNRKTGGVYWVTKEGKQPLTDRIFLSTIFKGRKILPKTPEALAKLKDLSPVSFFDGYLLKGESPAVYLISNGEKRPFSSGAVFERKGYAWRNIIKISEKLLNQYPLGLPIVDDNQAPEIISELPEVNTSSDNLTLSSKSALVITSDGKVLYSKNANEQLPLASLTKMVAIKVFLDTNPNLNKVVEYKVQDENYNYEWADKSVLARLRVNDGETMTIRDLLYSSILGSANNAVESLVRVSGLSRPDFISKMNSYAKGLGAKQTKFVEPTGLSPQNVTTASDYGLISQAVLKDGHLEKVSMTKEYKFTTVNTKKYHYIKNSNNLFFTSNLHITASKTGYLDEAKYCLMTRVKDEKGKEVIAITFGTPDRASSLKETETLLNYGLKYGG